MFCLVKLKKCPTLFPARYRGSGRVPRARYGRPGPDRELSAGSTGRFIPVLPFETLPHLEPVLEIKLDLGED